MNALGICCQHSNGFPYQKTLDIGANLFIGNLDPEIDEKMLYDTFSAFGVIISTPKIMRDQERLAPSLCLSFAVAAVAVAAAVVVCSIAWHFESTRSLPVISMFPHNLRCFTCDCVRRRYSGQSRGFGFVSFNNFESSDAAITAMNGQFLSGRPITVTYALKKVCLCRVSLLRISLSFSLSFSVPNRLSI